jgi:hypothetical protein
LRLQFGKIKLTIFSFVLDIIDIGLVSSEENR